VVKKLLLKDAIMKANKKRISSEELDEKFESGEEVANHVE
jgi:hypothetical protein